MRISAWSSDGCSSDLRIPKVGVRSLWFDQAVLLPAQWQQAKVKVPVMQAPDRQELGLIATQAPEASALQGLSCAGYGSVVTVTGAMGMARSEEHTSELQSLMRNSYAVFCLKKNKNQQHTLIDIK